MDDPHVLYCTDDHIGAITLNRPEVRNAFSPAMINLWRRFLEEARVDHAVRGSAWLSWVTSASARIGPKWPSLYPDGTWSGRWGAFFFPILAGKIANRPRCLSPW